jgi:hypothetical protein
MSWLFEQMSRREISMPKIYPNCVLISTICFFVALSSLQSMNIPPVELIGLHSCITPDKRHLSPWGGILAADSGWLENFYKCGNSDVEIKTDQRGRQEYVQREPRIFRQDATNVLCRSLFYCIPNISGISPSQYNSSPSKHLTIEKIAKLLELIDEVIQCHECTIEIVPESEEEAQIRKLTPRLEQERGKLKKADKIKVDEGGNTEFKIVSDSIESLSTQVASLEESLAQKIRALNPALVPQQGSALLDSLFDITDDAIEIILPIPKVQSKFLGFCTQALPAKHFNAQSKNRFVQLILKSLIESGQLRVARFVFRPFRKGVDPIEIKPNPTAPIVQLIQTPTYPEFFLGDLFLSLLYFKVQNVEDFRKYFNAFEKPILIDALTEQVADKEMPLGEILAKISVAARGLYEQIVSAEIEAMGSGKEGVYLELLERMCASQPISNNFELIAATTMTFKYPRQMPMMFKYQQDVQVHVDDGDKFYTNCAETAFLNFMSLILAKLGLYDVSSKCFLIDNDELLTSAVVNLLRLEHKLRIVLQRQLRDISEVSDGEIPTIKEEEVEPRKKLILANLGAFFTQAIRSKDLKRIHSAWSQMVTNKGANGVEYLQENFELTPYAGNFVKLTNLFLGTSCKDFEEISKLFGICDDTGSEPTKLDDKEYFKGNLSWKIGPNLNIPIYAMFDHGHGEFFIRPKKIFIKRLFRELASSDTTVNYDQAHLTYMCQLGAPNLQQRINISNSFSNPVAINALVYGYDITNDDNIIETVCNLFEIKMLHFFKGLQKVDFISKAVNIIYTACLPANLLQLTGSLNINLTESGISKQILLATLASVISNCDAPNLVNTLLNLGQLQPNVILSKGAALSGSPLYLAALSGHTATVKLLTGLGAPLSRLELIAAIQSCKKDLIEYLLISRPNLVHTLERSRGFGNPLGDISVFAEILRSEKSNLSKLETIDIFLQHGLKLQYRDSDIQAIIRTSNIELFKWYIEKVKILKNHNYYLVYLAQAIRMLEGDFSQGIDMLEMLIFKMELFTDNLSAELCDLGPVFFNFLNNTKISNEKYVRVIHLAIQGKLCLICKDEEKNNLLHIIIKHMSGPLELNLVKELVAIRSEFLRETNAEDFTPLDLAKKMNKTEIAAYLESVMKRD